jgi:hypothetical protein
MEKTLQSALDRLKASFIKGASAPNTGITNNEEK